MLKNLVEPDLSSHFVVLGVLMIMLSRTGKAPFISPNFRGHSLQILNTTMKIVGWAEKEDRASNFIQTDIVKEKPMASFGIGVANSTAGRSGRFHTRIHPSQHDGEFTTHGVAIRPQTIRIHFRLFFQKC